MEHYLSVSSTFSVLSMTEAFDPRPPCKEFPFAGDVQLYGQSLSHAIWKLVEANFECSGQSGYFAHL